MLLLGLILLGMSIGNLLGVVAVTVLSQFYTPLNMEQLAQLLQTPNRFSGAWVYIMIIQVFAHLFTFLIPSLVYWQWSEKHRIVQFFRKSAPSWPVLALAFLVVLGVMPFNSWIIEWNSHLTLPAGLKRIENWMRLKEDELSVLTQFLTQFNSYSRLAVALLVIAIIPAVGEEVLFRGIIQRKIYNKTGDMHVAIWVSAILFSAIHLQFYGFVPRMLLGALFGYLYAWSHNLWTPIFAHFVNNGFTVIMLFLHHRGMLQFDIETPESSVHWLGAAASLLLTVFLLLNLKKMAQRADFTQNGA